MAVDPILLVGGSGLVGRWATRFLKEAHPAVPILIAGRDAERARQAAAATQGAEPVIVDPSAEDLGLGDRPLAAAATLFTDPSGAFLRHAQRKGAGHISISPGIAELGPEVAAFIHKPQAAPVVLGTEWLVGATSVPTLILSRAFARLQEVRLGALLDEQDDFGPAATADLDRQTTTTSAALARRSGNWVWRIGEEAVATVRAVDGTEQPASAFSPNDVLTLATSTGAPDISFDLALGTSSTRRAGGPVSTEILIELSGDDRTGNSMRTRHAVVHPGGQMPLTGFGVALVLERLAGLVGTRPEPGLYFPSQLIEEATYLERLSKAGGQFIDLGG